MLSSPRRSIATTLILGYGLLGVSAIMLLSAVFYLGTIGVLEQNIDGKIMAVASRLQQLEPAALAGAVRRELSDGIDSEREILLLLDARGRRLAGNLDRWPAAAGAPPHAHDDDDELLSAAVVRDGRAIRARLLRHPLQDGTVLMVGRDLSEQEAVRALAWRALALGAAASLLMTVIGGHLFRRHIERRIGAIRRAAEEIGGGNLSRRIAVDSDDEFGLLNRDINRMLERIERLMDGVRHVSNAIAHDLRTPLGRIRSKLDDALRGSRAAGAQGGLASAAADAIDDIDSLIRLFERLLQIAEAESGVAPQQLEAVDLQCVAHDLLELYDASAEQAGVRLSVAPGAAVPVLGDRNLLATALASLLDNAIKYAGSGAVIELRATQQGNEASIAVCDNGPGIPAEERDKVTQRFYRLDKSRNLPGNGLGLAIVQAIATLHRGRLELGDARPGLSARIVLPRAAP
jgi:signal transduction histidine kinase